jgi:uncharacterized protein YcbX
MLRSRLLSTLYYSSLTKHTSSNFLRYCCNPSLDCFYNRSSARTLSWKALEVRRFRPNIVVESTTEEKKNDFIENLWVAKKLTIGEDIEPRIIGPCTRCVMITLPQGDLPKDLDILRTVAQYNRVTAGVYATVHGGETIRRGDRVLLEE